MNSSYFVIILMLFLILYITKRNEMAVLKNIIKKRKTEDKDMVELAKQFVDKECIVYTFNSQITGTVKSVSDGAILLENGGTLEAVNLDFIVRIREYPRKKNGKKKAVVID